jgi:hypothetical protein
MPMPPQIETVAKGVIPFHPFFGAEKDYLQVL